MLILGFLRSAANVLNLGPVPSFTPPKKIKKSNDDDDDDYIVDPAELHEEDNTSAPVETATRGTVLITLRNVTPYTLWYCYCMPT